MNVSVNNNLAFKASSPAERVASLNDSDINTISNAMAYKDYKKRANVTNALGLGLLATYPVFDSLATSAVYKGSAMSTRLKEGMKEFGKLGVMLAATFGIIKLTDNAVKSSPKATEFVHNNPATFLAAEMAGIFGIMYGGQKLLPMAYEKLSEFAGPKAKELVKRIDKFELLDKAKNGISSLKNKTRDVINKLNGGKIESALDKVSDMLVKDGEVTKTRNILVLSVSAVIFGILGKQIYDTAKYSKDAKENKKELTELRSVVQDMVQPKVEECEPEQLTLDI